MNQDEQSAILRNFLNANLEAYAVKLNPSGWSILEIGIAGDEKPSGSYKFFGQGNNWTTMDIEPKWSPDIVADITDNDIPDNKYDLVIMTQALEHIWDYKKALSEIYRITNKFAIVDCPFMYPFHQDVQRPRRWQDWDDYWRITPAGINRLLEEVGFNEIDINFNDLVTLCVANKQ